MLIDRWLSCTNRNWLHDPNQELTSHMTTIWNKNQMKPLIRPHFTLINKYNVFFHTRGTIKYVYVCIRGLRRNLLLFDAIFIYKLFFKTFPRKIGSVGRNKKRRSICANIVATSPPTQITHSNRLKTYLM